MIRLAAALAAAAFATSAAADGTCPILMDAKSSW